MTLVAWVNGWIDTGNNYTTLITNLLTSTALIYAAIQWFRFSIKRTLHKSRQKILKDTRKFKSLSRSERRSALRGIKDYVKKIIQGVAFFPADEIDLLSFLLNSNQSLTFYFSKQDLKNLAFSYMEMSNNLKKRIFFGMNSTLIEEQATFCVQVADLLFFHASLSGPTSDDTITSSFKMIKTGNKDSVIEYYDFFNDSLAYKLSVSWFKEMQTINSEYQEGFDRNSRFPMNRQFKSEVGVFTSKRNYDAVLPSLIEVGQIPMIKTSVDQRNGEHYLELSIGETTYSSVESLRERENQHFEINKAITISMIVMAEDGKILVPKRADNQGIDSYQGSFTTSVNGNLDIPTRFFGNKDYDKFGLPDFYKAIVREAKEELNLELNPKKIVVHGVVRIFTPKDYGTWVLCMSYQSSRSVEELDRFIKTNRNILGNYETSEVEWFTFHQLDKEVDKSHMMPHLVATYNLLGKYLDKNNQKLNEKDNDFLLTHK